ncbi:hypothetical protein FBZ99_101328 [Rhizobium sp. ERR 1071]|uniref:hypothetical protein n=1 Tax=Rhizobium sp. ERR 1071 TaxID=2572677 RepID=UPI00119A6118|nr:hypothetical protein [Rhizobium sp. ERR1071]TWB19555.1 hypothetical protein FBZ99_101328 [Rhizobium sp. ERR1071]
MDTHTHTERTLLPRGLIGRRRRVYIADWTYKLNSFVEYRGERALVIDRHRTIMGVEIYTIIPVTAAPERRYVLGRSLKHIH